MKISNDNPVIPPDSRAIERDSGRAAAPKPGQSEDLVELSHAATVSDSDRSARIEKLSAAVRDGSYKVSPEDIAGAIVDEMLGK